TRSARPAADAMLPRMFAVEAALLLAACAARGGEPAAAPRTSYAGEPVRGRKRVLLVTEENARKPYLEMALRAGDDIDLEKLDPRAFDEKVATGSLPAYTVIVLDDHTPAALPPGPVHLLYFHPTGERAPFRLGRPLRHVEVDRVEGEHAVLRGVAIAGSRLDAAAELSVNPARGEIALAAAGQSAVIAGRSSPAGRVVACSFRPTDTAWTLQATFAVFVHNALDWLAAGDRPRDPNEAKRKGF
ncbi:MAG TPA: hypothetical protein VFU21_02635, partial [Kofleriaceae bacterium]|nr:hypothetical protein [Kofleriaceae bacterium]